jgi:hypothetical protein
VTRLLALGPRAYVPSDYSVLRSAHNVQGFQPAFYPVSFAWSKVVWCS